MNHPDDPNTGYEPPSRFDEYCARNDHAYGEPPAPMPAQTYAAIMAQVERDAALDAELARLCAGVEARAYADRVLADPEPRGIESEKAWGWVG